MRGADTENEWPLPMSPPNDETEFGVTASSSAENVPIPKRAIVFSDTDNDIVCVEKTLRYAGIINDKGQLTRGVEGLDFIHTGDLVNKKNPDPAVADYWDRFRRFVDLRGCRVRIIAGNHEIVAWQRINEGETYGLPRQRLEEILRFVETLDLFHVEDTVLFLHGYPTLAFLRTLLHFREVTGEDLNRFNEEHFRKAFKSPEAVNQYAYVQGKAGENYILADVAVASVYYKKHGRNVVTLLKELGIGTVIHGHRPQRSGRQADYEFANWIPGVRMVSNDTKVRVNGMGATVIRMPPREAPDIVFINTLTDSKKTRSRVSELITLGDVGPASSQVEPPIDTEPSDSVFQNDASGGPGSTENARVPVVENSSALQGKSVAKKEQPRVPARASQAKTRRSTRWRRRIGVAVFIAALAGFGIYWLNSESQREQVQSTPELSEEKMQTEY